MFSNAAVLIQFRSGHCDLTATAIGLAEPCTCRYRRPFGTGGDSGVHLVTYNIQFSRGKDYRYDLSRIAEAVRGAGAAMQ